MTTGFLPWASLTCERAATDLRDSKCNVRSIGEVEQRCSAYLDELHDDVLRVRWQRGGESLIFRSPFHRTR